MRHRSSRIWTTAWLSAFVLGVAATAGHAAGPAARQGDVTTHSGAIAGGSTNVRIQGQFAARLGDFATCPIPFHVGGPIVSASGSVFINGVPAARVGETIVENGSVSAIAVGAATVIIGD